MQKDLEYFTKLNYDAVMRMKGDEYCLFIPELSIIASGKTPDEAYKELFNEKERFFINVIELNLQETVNEPAIVKIRKKQYQDIFQFILKVFITFLVFVVLFVVFFLPVLSSIENALAYKVWTVSEAMLIKVVDKVDNKLSSMPEKEKDATLLRIRGILQKVKPYSNEIKILFQDDEKLENQGAKSNGNGDGDFTKELKK